MAILKSKQKIIITKVQKGEYKFRSYGEMKTEEIADALLGAFCKCAKYLVDKERLTPELIKGAAIMELDNALKSGESKGVQNEK